MPDTDVDAATPEAHQPDVLPPLRLDEPDQVVPEMAVVDVRLVEPIRIPKVMIVRQAKPDRWSAFRGRIVGEEAKRIVGAMPMRTSLVIRNTVDPNASPNADLYVSPNEPGNGDSNTSFTVAPGGVITFEHTAEVYGVADAGQTVTWEAIAEFDGAVGAGR